MANILALGTTRDTDKEGDGHDQGVRHGEQLLTGGR